MRDASYTLVMWRKHENPGKEIRQEKWMDEAMQEMD